MARYWHCFYFMLLVLVSAWRMDGAEVVTYSFALPEEAQFSFDTLKDRYQMRQKLQQLKQYEQINEKYGEILSVLSVTDLEIIRKIAHNVSQTHPTLSPAEVQRSVFACSFAAKYHEVSVEKAVALAYIESTFRPTSKSSAACRGLTQLSSLIWRVYGEKYGMDTYDVYNPFANAVVGVGYLAALISSHKGNEERALAFYNGGGKFGQASVRYAQTVLRVADKLRLYRNVKK